jgi:hypothetical protein
LKQPFQYILQDGHGPREGHLKFDDGTVVAVYFNALNHGVSDTAAKLRKPDEPLQDRVKSLVRSLALLRERKWEKPHLVTAAWIEEASRIKRRVTTQGGEDTFLVDHVHKCISERPEVVSRLKSSLRKEELWEVELKSTVEDLCMFKDDHFKFVWINSSRFPSDKNPRFKAILDNEPPAVFEKLSELPDDSWGNDILKTFTVPELLQVLKLDHEIANAPLIVLQLVPIEWDFIGEVRG